MSLELADYGISFRELTKLCPRQHRSRNLCLFLAKEIVGEDTYKKQLIQSKKLPKTELAGRFQISGKTIEKYRKYIVTLVILLLGDYPGIKTFLPEYKEVDE